MFQIWNPSVWLCKGREPLITSVARTWSDQVLKFTNVTNFLKSRLTQTSWESAFFSNWNRLWMVDGDSGDVYLRISDCVRINENINEKRPRFIEMLLFIVLNELKRFLFMRGELFCEFFFWRGSNFARRVSHGFVKLIHCLYTMKCIVFFFRAFALCYIFKSRKGSDSINSSIC